MEWVVRSLDTGWHTASGVVVDRVPHSQPKVDVINSCGW